MYNIVQDLLDAYRATPETLQALLSNYSHAGAASAHSEEQDWSVVEVICHLRDSEEASLQRTRWMRDQTNPRLLARDPEKLAVERNYADTSLESALSAFLRFRADHIQELAVLSAEQWERTLARPTATI